MVNVDSMHEEMWNFSRKIEAMHVLQQQPTEFIIKLLNNKGKNKFGGRQVGKGNSI